MNLMKLNIIFVSNPVHIYKNFRLSFWATEEDCYIFNIIDTINAKSMVIKNKLTIFNKSDYIDFNEIEAIEKVENILSDLITKVNVDQTEVLFIKNNIC